MIEQLLLIVIVTGIILGLVIKTRMERRWQSPEWIDEQRRKFLRMEGREE